MPVPAAGPAAVATVARTVTPVATAPSVNEQRVTSNEHTDENRIDPRSLTLPRSPRAASGIVYGATTMSRTLGAALIAFGAVLSAAAPVRVPVLGQIALPHNYYYRELYLPQLTSGPSAVAWSADGQALVYSMQGSLWRQRVDGTVAEQLTDGGGDYQPHCSPDGRRVVFVRYDGRSIELMLLDLASREVRALTTGGAVNVEPRWSPDGRRLAFVSTAETGHFLLHIAEVRDGRLERHRAAGRRPPQQRLPLLLQPLRSRDQPGLDP